MPTGQGVALGVSEARITVIRAGPEPHRCQHPSDLDTSSRSLLRCFHMGPSSTPVPWESDAAPQMSVQFSCGRTGIKSSLVSAG